ncbi:MAG: nucleotidyltransferase family protein [Thermoplasmatales archaeon]|nr:nucleotidyltransferase family protein [Thermoplasmatales archaeon]
MKERIKKKKTLEEIKEILKENEAILRERFNVKEIGIFGSYVRDEQKGKSDLDILVEFEAPVSLFEFMDMEEYLKKTLGVNVDLVSKKALKPRIGKHILEEVVYT